MAASNVHVGESNVEVAESFVQSGESNLQVEISDVHIETCSVPVDNRKVDRNKFWDRFVKCSGKWRTAPPMQFMRVFVANTR